MFRHLGIFVVMCRFPHSPLYSEILFCQQLFLFYRIYELFFSCNIDFRGCLSHFQLISTKKQHDPSGGIAALSNF